MFRDSCSSISTDVETLYDIVMDEHQTNVAFNAGDILVTCRPYIHIISDSMKGKLCDLCLRPPIHSILHVCRECKQINFCTSCNISCSPSIFKTIHNLECPLLVKYGQILSSTSKLFLRLYLRLKNPESIHYQIHLNPLTKEEITFECLPPPFVLNGGHKADDLCDRIRSCYEKFAVEQEYENMDDHDKEIITVEDVALLQFINLLDELRLCEDLMYLISDDYQIYEIWKVFVRLWAYAVPIFDETITGLFSKDAIAYGLYLEPSVVIESHSCLPNCAFSHYGPVIQLRAMKPIQNGENLTINYVDVTSSKKERLIELRNYYIDGCFCLRCLHQQHNDGNDDDLIDLEKFNSIKQEFVSMYNTDFIDSGLDKNCRILHSSSKDNNYVENYVRNSYEKCIKISNLAKKLNEFYEKIYLFNHPEKSKFLFAYLAVEMNLLLFKLEFREHSHNGTNGNDVETQAKPNSTVLLNKNHSRESGSITILDTIILDIENWSNLLKRTVKSIRWTHGTDHRLYRDTPIPLADVWHEAFGNRRLTLDELYCDPSILLHILCSFSSNRSSNDSNSFLLEQLDFLKSHFARLIPAVVKKSEMAKNNKLIKSSYASTFMMSPFDFVKIGFRFLLILFALIFPLFIYFTLYFQTSDF